MKVTNTDFCPICGSYMELNFCPRYGFSEKPLKGYYKDEHPQAMKKRANVKLRVGAKNK